MNIEQLLKNANDEIAKLKRQLSSQKSSNTKQKNIIKELVDALDNLKRQYAEMVRSSDANIASQASEIEELRQEVQKLRREIQASSKEIS
jgi:archaellum component FlaC